MIHLFVYCAVPALYVYVCTYFPNQDQHNCIIHQSKFPIQDMHLRRIPFLSGPSNELQRCEPTPDRFSVHFIAMDLPWMVALHQVCDDLERTTFYWLLGLVFLVYELSMENSRKQRK